MFPSCTLKGLLKNEKYKINMIIYNEKDPWWK
jgi:hypothetical protein